MVDRSLIVIQTQPKNVPNIIKRTLSKTDDTNELIIPEVYNESDIDVLTNESSDYVISNNDDKSKVQRRKQSLKRRKVQPAFEMVSIKKEPLGVKEEFNAINVSDSDDDVIIKSENLNQIEMSDVKIKDEPIPDKSYNDVNGQLNLTTYQSSHSILNQVTTENIPELSDITKKEIEIINVFTVLRCMNCSSVERLIDKQMDNFKCTACCSNMNHQCNICKKVFSTLSFIYLHLLKKHIQFSRTIAVNKRKNENSPREAVTPNSIINITNNNHNKINHMSSNGDVNPVRQYDPEGYKCKKCNIWYSREVYLIKHEQSCQMVPNLCCKFCPSRLNFKSQLRIHMLDDHKQDFQIEDLEDILDSIISSSKKLRGMLNLILGCCITCKTKTPVGSQQSHCHICETELIYQCGVVKCSASYSSVEHLIQHVRTDHATLSGVCEKCDNVYNSREELDLHRVDCSDGAYTCANCLFRSVSTDELEQHARSVHLVMSRERGWQCNRCGKIFYRKEQLEIHERCDCLDTTFDCDHCNFTAADKNTLVVHLRCTHVTLFTGKLPQCHKCGNKWSSVFKLYNHVGQCSGDHELEKAKMMKKNNLELNENETAKSQELDADYEKSDLPLDLALSGDNDPCNNVENVVSEKNFPEATNDDRAQKLMNIFCVNCNDSPDGVASKGGVCPDCELPYINRCWECGREFNRWYMLLVHVNRKHGPDKLHQCWGCAKSFYLRKDAEKHELVCTKLAAYAKAGVPRSCGSCGKSYGRATMMETHIKYCGKGECRLLCDQCGWTFKSKRKLARHIREQHAEMSHDKEGSAGSKCSGRSGEVRRNAV